MLRIQMPFGAGETSEPEPDLAVVPLGSYIEKPPDTARLIIEVSDSTLEHDRLRKAPLYARCSVPVYWIVNIPERCVEVRTEPGRSRYRRVVTARPGDVLAVPGMPRLKVPISALFHTADDA